MRNPPSAPLAHGVATQQPAGQGPSVPTVLPLGPVNLSAPIVTRHEGRFNGRRVAYDAELLSEVRRRLGDGLVDLSLG